MVAAKTARRRACQRKRFDHLFAWPADLDNAVEVLRFNVACLLDHMTLEEIAAAGCVGADRLVRFMDAQPDTAGERLTLAEAAGLMRVAELRLEDREIVAELNEYARVAKPYIEAARFDFAAAARSGREVLDSFRAANPTASQWAAADESERTVSE